MNYDSVFSKVAHYYSTFVFIFDDVNITSEDVTDLSHPSFHALFDRINLIYEFLFHSNLKHSYNQSKTTNKKTLVLDISDDDYFILMLILIDIIEEMVSTLGPNININKYLG